MKMNKNIIFGLLVGLTTAGIIFSGCINNSQEGNHYSGIQLECEPTVVVTGINYSLNPNSVPYDDSHNIFTENYTASDLSIELRDKIIQSMMEKADELGENSTVLYEAIKVIYYDNWDEKPYSIPCYAEKAFYNNESVWVIAFNRANGPGSIGHFDLYFVSISTLEAQYNSGCESTTIVYHFGCK